MGHTLSYLEIVELGERPPLGVVPRRMYAQAIRQDRFGSPACAMKQEIVDVPEPGPGEVLVAVMAAGVNHNTVWAAQGSPVDVIAYRQRRGAPEAFHIGGSDASGIVYQVGPGVTRVKVGDEVVLHCMQWDEDDPWIRGSNDPLCAPSCRVWGYESNWGSFAQFCKVQARQCYPKPRHLSWAESAVYFLCGMTAYRMLHHWSPNHVSPGDVVLVWGGAGGLGVMAIQLARLAGAIPVAVVSSPERGERCLTLGAAGYIDRTRFDHWRPLTSDINDHAKFLEWTDQVRKFGKAIWEITGNGNNPSLVVEHPGEQTMPTSLYVCAPGGMVVTCAGTSGFNATLDLRFLWMRSKRLQGSHAADDADAAAFNNLICEGKIQPCLAHTFAFEDTGLCHQWMSENRHPAGNMAILVGASKLEPTGPADGCQAVPAKISN
ncbi:MAG TPA: crotonyl-CoA carboxylase/reductase [Terracidiphilus sp.]|nr:crotonyl-CoA carboxylase/reductase [Terracidiphilus sp.]